MIFMKLKKSTLFTRWFNKTYMGKPSKHLMQALSRVLLIGSEGFLGQNIKKILTKIIIQKSMSFLKYQEKSI